MNSARFSFKFVLRSIGGKRPFREDIQTAFAHSRWFHKHKSYHTKAGLLTRRFPQPVSLSHPHQLSDGEVTPLIHKDEFKQRRVNLGINILEHSDRTKANLIIIPAAAKVYMSGHIPYVFRQNSDFLYFTGCLEPDAVLVLASLPRSEEFFPTLFVPHTDAQTEVWEGPKLDLDFTLNHLGISQANYTAHLASYLSAFIADNQLSGVQIWRDSSQLCKTLDDVMSKQCGSINVMDVTPVIEQLRLIKSAAEQQLMRKSCEIIAQAGIETVKISKPGICESHLWATVDYNSRIRGAQYLAYPPVVAGGSRANTIHYTDNNQLIMDGELVLMDAGCEYYGYTSDMTRCWPVNGEFTEYQKQAYEVVLDVQLDLINFCRERPPLDQLFQRMCRLLGKNLQEIGFGSSSASCVEKAQMAYSVCPHHVSHYLGLDVHDTGKISRGIPLKPGMVITIEPGLYVDLNRSVAPKEFHGIGLRIEDDILITETGVEVLTESCPKTIDAIEKIVQTS